MATALLGYTGFVGSNIAARHDFDELYNTANIDEIDGQNYELVVAAATYAEMWKINQDPAGDLAQIDGLIKHLKNVKAKKFVLISTVGVYQQPVGVDESTVIATSGLAAYGVNRYYLEKAVSELFDATIIRLPGLFGQGLKKNVIYDLLNNHQVENVHSEGSYQYYNLGNIWKDINIALKNKLQLVNFATEPIKTAELAADCFGMTSFSQKPAGTKPANWDVHSIHAKLFGGQAPYLYSKQQVLADIKSFVKQANS